MSRHDRLIAKAIDAAKLSECGYRVAALAVRGSRILSIGVNRWRNSSVVPVEALTVHAEAAALMQVNKTEGLTLYVARVGRNGIVSMARPCRKMCWPMLVDAKIKEVVYTTWDSSYALERVM